jgi:hypothetical protein
MWGRVPRALAVVLLHDTGEAPDNEAHWICLAASGRDARSFRHRGTFKDNAEYASHDIVALNGGSFLALHDKPGVCPGPGWQLLCAQGKRGVTGEPGPRGATGIAGPSGADAVAIVGWNIDRAAYTVVPIMSDGSRAPPLNLRGLFEQFQDEVG